MTHLMRQWCLAVVLLAGFDVHAHGVSSAARDPLGHAATAPAPGAPVERVGGTVHRLVITDRVAGVTLTEYAARLDDGTTVALRGAVGPQSVTIPITVTPAPAEQLLRDPLKLAEPDKPKDKVEK